jgi:hypothetical protein
LEGTISKEGETKMKKINKNKVKKMKINYLRKAFTN